MIILVIGKNCSGKTTFREYASKRKNVITFEASDYIKKAKSKYNISDTRKLLDKLGDDYAAEQIYNLIVNEEIAKSDIIISGFRTLSEVEFITEHFGEENIKIVVLEANSLLCYLRNIIRNRDDKQLKLKEFVKHQRKDNELGFNGIISKYEVTYIFNNSSRKKFNHQVDAFLDRNLMRTNQRKIFEDRVKLKYQLKQEE